jgi:hypothetical protein
MSDELLRHLAINSGKLRKTKHFDPALNRERERLEGGTWLSVLQVLCYHANQKERQVWCGIAKLGKEAGCNLDATYRYLELFEHLGWIEKRAPRRTESHHKPANCWEITLPEMESLATLQARLEQQEREWEESSPVHSPHRSPVRSPQKSANGSTIDAEGVEAGEHKHKHKNSPAKKSHLKIVPTHAAEEKSLLEQTLEIYAECSAAKAVNAIQNPDAWKAKLISNAGKAKPLGSELTYTERTQRALEAGYKPLDIGRWLADGCPSNGAMTHWDKRSDYAEQPLEEAPEAHSDLELRDIERHLQQNWKAPEAENE